MGRWMGTCCLRAVLLAQGLSLVAACEWPDFDSPSEVTGLRILGLQASSPLGVPGEELVLDALWVDARPAEDDEVVSAWFPGCVNPQFGALQPCVDDLNDLDREPGADWPEEFAPVLGDRFETTVNAGLLAGREEYGIQYFFFAVCRGSRFEFAPSQHETVPIICRDAEGDPVDPPDFRVGFRTVTAIPEPPPVRVGNPEIIGFDVDGVLYEPHCLGAECIGFQQPNCEERNCPQFEPIDPEDECDSQEAPEECEATRFRVLIDEESLNIDWVLSTSGELQGAETYARYYITGGEVTPESDLLYSGGAWGDDDGWDDENQAAVWSEEDVFLWAVVHDAAGGSAWAGLGIRGMPLE